MRAYLLALAVAAPLVFVLAAGLGRKSVDAGSPLLNRAAPDFALTSLDGGRVSLRRLRGHPVIVNFWASWCSSCRGEHPFLRQAWQRVHSRVRFLAIAYQDPASNARAFLKQHPVPWPVLADPNQQTAINYGVAMVPETYFIDRRGVVRYKSAGPVTPALLKKQIARVTTTGPR